MNDTISSLLAAKIMSDMADNDTPKSNLSLEALLSSYNKAETFRPGDHVTWKEGLSNKTTPKPGESAIVLEVLAQPLVDDTNEVSSPYYGEKLDLKLAVKTRSGDMVFYHYDSNRFKLVKRYLDESDL